VLEIVKTTGGNNVAPSKCDSCGGIHFAKSGIAWHCTACGVYHPTKLGLESLKASLNRLKQLKNQMTFVRQDLEQLVKE
jgi:threonine synthase